MSNPNHSLDTLSTSQQQLLTSVQQLQDAQKDLMNRYSGATDPTERTKIANEMDKNETLRSNLLSSSGAVALVQGHAIDTKQDAAADLTAMTLLMEAELKSARDQLEEIQTIRNGKERMIQLNTYYGKRFMAQAGVMKIFIYMCIPIIILAVLANMGFLPNYIAGFAIIASIVIGIVYIYGAVHDINRRDKMNFDEYTWEFDPSRVGTVINPHHHHKKKDSAAAGCSNEACCESKNQWNPRTNKCDVQGDKSHVKGTSHALGKTGATSIANTAAPATGLLGDLSAPSPSATSGPNPSQAPTSNLCWTNANRALKGQCMGDWTYDGVADTCTAPVGSVASSIQMCSPYKVPAMNSTTQGGWEAFVDTCKVGGQYDSPNCV
jgi:hypothetical protein